MNLPNIEYKGEFSKCVQAKDDPFEFITFYKPKEYFYMPDDFTKFAKDTEKLVRKHEDYSIYKDWLMHTVGLNFCQVSTDIYDTDATIEMHHGPLFTLFDYVSIILAKKIACNEKITTFRVADEVLQEHFELRVQTVMLAVTNHEAVHNRDIWLNIKQGFGDIAGFIERYKPYLSDEQKYRIAKYISLCETNDSFDNFIFDTERVKKVLRVA